MKKRRRFWLAAIAVICLISAILFALLRDPHGIYQGKPVRQWAMELSVSPNAQERAAATAAFQAMGSNAVTPLKGLLRAREPFYQKFVVKISRNYPATQREKFLARFNLMDAPILRMSATRALAVIGPDAQAAVPALAGALHDPDSRVSWGASLALGKIRGSAVPVLTDTLRDPSSDLRQFAAAALGMMGTNAAPAIPALIHCLGDPVAAVRSCASSSLTAIGPAAAPPLILIMEQERGLKQQTAARTLGGIQPRNDEASDALLRMLGQADTESRVAAIETLGAIRPPRPNTVTTIIGLLNDKNPSVRLAATKVMSDFTWRHRVKSAVPALMAELQDPDPALREWSARALGWLGVESSNAVPTLTLMHDDPEKSVRLAATNALNNINAALAARR